MVSETQDTSQEIKVLKFKKKKQLNIGIIMFGIIFIYLIATVVMYITAPKITSYEVRQGSILKDTACTGLAIRNETIVTSEENGYINYFVPDCSKVKVGSKIYTLSDSELNFETVTETNEVELTAEQERSIMQKLNAFSTDFQEQTYIDTYSLKQDIVNSLDILSSQGRISQLNQLLQSGASNATVHHANHDGIVVYRVDGYEELTLDTVQMDHLEKGQYTIKEFTNNSKIATGDPIYKIVSDNDWQILIPLSNDMAEALQDKTTIKINFVKDNQNMRVGLQMIELEGHPVAVLSLSNSMVRYASERYIDIELILEDETGLKIPKSAEVKKDFFVVPKDYITQGGDSSNLGILRLGTSSEGESIIEFVPVDIYYEDEEVVYLDPLKLNPKDLLQKPDSNDTYQLSEMRSLTGVYCINKGYAVFKQIHILCESDDYYIVEEGNSYGLSNYDHIALDSSNIKENDVVF